MGLNSAVPMSLLPDTAQVGSEGRLMIGGVDVVGLADTYGTPLFVYDEQHLLDRCEQAVSAWGPGVAYATKAFLCKEMARLAYRAGMLLDVSTGGEMHTALDAGVPGSSLILHGNNKSLEELSTALSNKVARIVIDSFDEIDRLAALASTDTPQAVMIRVTPGIEAHTHEYVRTGQEDSKFGFGLERGDAARAVVAVRNTPGLDLVGIHAHIGSQVFAAESFAKAVEVLAGFFVGLDLEELCIGGGLGVGYVEGETAPTISQWASVVKKAAKAAGIPSQVRITAEPGRSIVAQAAITIYRAGTIKQIAGLKTFIAVDGGMSDNPRPVLYGSGYEIFSPSDVLAERSLIADVVGKHCESGDFIVKAARVPASVAVGTYLATPVSGAYGYSMASNYNRVPRPAVLFVKDGQSRVVVRRETFEDLVALDV